MNVICQRGLVVENKLAWGLVTEFSQVRFSGAERHLWRVAKVAGLEDREAVS